MNYKQFIIESASYFLNPDFIGLANPPRGIIFGWKGTPPSIECISMTGPIVRLAIFGEQKASPPSICYYRAVGNHWHESLIPCTGWWNHFCSAPENYKEVPFKMDELLIDLI